MAFSFIQKVLFKHCDPAGIVFFPRYFEMMNDCVEAFFDEALDWPFEKLLQTAGIPTATIKTQFTVPSRHGDKLVLHLEIIRLGYSSFDYLMTAHCAGEQRFKTDATIVHVNLKGKPAPIPDAVRQRLTNLIKVNS